MSKEVVGLCWDLTMGAADTGFGQTILEWATPDGGNTPPGVYHVGLMVFGYVYEFSQHGMNKSVPKNENRPNSGSIAAELKRKDKLGFTSRTKQEFDNWVKNSQTRFKASTYDIVSLNCIVWATEACNFLGVQAPAVWKDIKDLAENNSGTAKLFYDLFN